MASNLQQKSASKSGVDSTSVKAANNTSSSSWTSIKQQFPSPSGEKTFSNQKKLKPLPVPPLDHSCQLYLQSLIPLLTDQELANSKLAVEEFRNGIGPTLQKRLEERSKEQWKYGKNWLEDWWRTWAYLKWPDPIVINSNFYEVSETPCFKPGLPQAFTAARLVYGVRKYMEFLQAELKAPHYMGKAPLCMNQYYPLFTTARIPGEDEDKLIHLTPSNQIVVICRNQFYAVDIYHEGAPLTTRDLEQQLKFILEDTQKYIKPQYSVGLMTASDRKEWAKFRKDISKSQQNAFNLKTIDEATVIICLDDASPTDDNEMGELLIAGDANGRWFDKIVQYVIFSNGRVGVNGEHSPVDAPATEEIANFMMDSLRDLQDFEYPDFGEHLDLPQPKRLHWELAPQHYQVLSNAQAAYNKLRADHDLRLMRYWSYGTELIKKMGLSPDSFVQMAMQLAFFKIHKKTGATYETGHTRLFWHGRTETVRSCSKESAEWTKAMQDPSVSKETKIQLLKTAIDSHKDYMGKVLQGKGCDRHFLGLRILAGEAIQKGEIPDMPAIFKDPAFSKSSSFLLSTSSMGNSEGYYVGGFGCFLPGSYGICYQPWKNSLHFSVTSRRQTKETNSLQFEQALTESLDDIRNLFDLPSKL